ncbi:MAG: deoxynucleoside kinase [Chitinispirillia bacterium]|nr:deoxynucleoside kinase [Chitinispirillia bacterium]MCL2267623.1 deoxynucleoside kinase [Chitinispirillia bacterium]
MAHELKFPPHINFLCVEGVLGVGKTSLCDLLGRDLGARLVREDVEGNPFLPNFYSDRRSLAFQTQIWFLLSRHRQLTEAVAQQDLFHTVTVSDYMFDKDYIFASLNLQDDELALYNTVAHTLETSVPRPDLVVYLQASTETLLRRIDKRGRPYEDGMDEGYINSLNEAYNHYFHHYTASPLLIINTNELDFVDDVRDFREIIEQIVNARPGVNIYNPLSHKDKMAVYEQAEN